MPSASAQITTPAAARRVWVMGDELAFMGSVEGAHVGVVEVSVPPGSGTPPHRHASVEIFRVIEGEVTFGLFGDGPPRMVAAGAGTVVTIPGNLGHNYANRSDRPARFAAVVEDQMLRFFEDVGTTDMPPPGPPSDADIGRIMAACARHGIEIIGAP